jgi:hypothetical protein
MPANSLGTCEKVRSNSTAIVPLNTLSDPDLFIYATFLAQVPYVMISCSISASNLCRLQQTPDRSTDRSVGPSMDLTLLA